MKHAMTQWLAIGAAAVAMACSTQPVVTTSRTTTVSSGDVALNDASGMWIDTVGGTWIDTTGALWRGGRRGTALGIQTADLRTMTDANIVAHLAAGDSLEVALSQQGADRAQNVPVRDFALRMVTEHSAHLQAGRQLATQGGITPALSPADTADASMVTRVMTRLANTPAGPAYDRQLMRAEVMMHQHMLHELMLVRPQATGAALQLVDQTIPVVRQHLADAEAIWRQVGGGMNDARSGGTNP
jgi:predicted outer membrane protein